MLSAQPSASAREGEPAEQVVPVAVGGEQPARRGEAAPARAATASSSSSSGSTGESITNASGRRRARGSSRGSGRADDRAVQPPARALVTTSTSRVQRDGAHGCAARSGDAEQLGRLLQVRAPRRSASSGEESSVSLLRLTQITGHALFDAGHDVVVVAGGDVHPAALAAHAPRALGEVGGFGLVGAHLLRGHDEVEVDRDVPARLPEQLVVDVREQARACTSWRASAAAGWSP